MSRLPCFLLIIVLGIGSLSADPPVATGPADLKAQKDALAHWNNLIGGWRGTGQPRRGSNVGAWREDNNWAWQFSETEAALVGTVTKGKLAATLKITAGAEAGTYKLEWTSPEKTVRNLNGKIEDGKLVLSSAPDEMNEVYRVTLTLLNDLRTLILFEKRKADQQSYNRLAEVGYTAKGRDWRGRAAAGRNVSSPEVWGRSRSSTPERSTTSAAPAVSRRSTTIRKGSWLSTRRAARRKRPRPSSRIRENSLFLYFHSNDSPESRSYASMYFDRVCVTTSLGKAGGGLFLSQVVDSSQSRTNCLSNDGCPRPGW